MRFEHAHIVYTHRLAKRFVIRGLDNGRYACGRDRSPSRVANLWDLYNLSPPTLVCTVHTIRTPHFTVNAALDTIYDVFEYIIAHQL